MAKIKIQQVRSTIKCPKVQYYQMSEGAEGNHASAGSAQDERSR